MPTADSTISCKNDTGVGNWQVKKVESFIEIGRMEKYGANNHTLDIILQRGKF